MTMTEEDCGKRCINCREVDWEGDRRVGVLGGGGGSGQQERQMNGWSVREEG